MLPDLQNSGRAKWGSARADRILKARVSDKNGISFAGSETLQISTAAPDFCFSRAQRLWDVICAIWDLLRCTEICKSAVIEFSAGREIYQQIFHRFFPESFFFGGASRTPVAEGGGALWKADQYHPARKAARKAVWAVRHEESAPLDERCRSPGHSFGRRAACNRSPDGVERPQ